MLARLMESRLDILLRAYNLLRRPTSPLAVPEWEVEVRLRPQSISLRCSLG
jgi:hypothetical protein